MKIEKTLFEDKKKIGLSGKGPPEGEILEIFLIFKHGQWWNQTKALKKLF